MSLTKRWMEETALNGLGIDGEAEIAWLKQVREWERRGIEPGQFTAFITGYKLGKSEGIAQGTLDGYDAGAKVAREGL
jgi:hypothetical protein